MIGHYIGVPAVTETEAREVANLPTERLVHREKAIGEEGDVDIYVFAVPGLVDDWEEMLGNVFPELQEPNAPYIEWEER